MPFAILIAVVGLIINTQRVEIAHIEAMTRAGMCARIEQNAKVWRRCDAPEPVAKQVPVCWSSAEPGAPQVPCAAAPTRSEGRSCTALSPGRQVR